MSRKDNIKAGFVRPSFVGWTIFQIIFAESLIIDLRCKFGNTAKIQALTAEIPEGEGDQHRAKRSFEDWRKNIRENFKI